MKKFIAAFRDLKSRPDQLNAKLVWNPKPLYEGKNWLVTTMFSKKYIEFQGLEVVK